MMTVCLLGASGSIGQQTIDVMKKNRQDFSLLAFSVGHRTRCISSIIKLFPEVKAVCLKDKKLVKKYQNRYPSLLFFYGDEGLNELIKASKAEMVVNALVGFVGLKPTLVSLKENKIVALANKESLVVGGEIITNLLKEGHGKLIPIDSEHVAIAKCLAVDNKNVNKIIITASGGAFRNLNRQQLKDVTPEEALNHPNWNMGHKITIDSATMVNKAFEIIEAHYLFNYGINQIDVILNLNSFVHSIILYNDGTYRMEVGKPDMRKPIKYALYQGLLDYQTIVSDDLNKVKNTTFAPFDINRYPIVDVAYKVIKEKGALGAIFNASNEVAVYAFLNKEIPFLAIEAIINKCLKEIKNVKHPDYEKLLEIDTRVRSFAKELIRKGDY